MLRSLPQEQRQMVWRLFTSITWPWGCARRKPTRSCELHCMYVLQRNEIVLARMCMRSLATALDMHNAPWSMP